MKKIEDKYIVFAEEQDSDMQEALIQQSNPLYIDDAIKFAERIRGRDNIFGITILKEVSQEELNQNKYQDEEDRTTTA